MNATIEYYRRKGMLVHTGLSTDDISRAMRRTSGDCVCEMCGKLHRQHPLLDDELDFDDRPYLHLLCDGTIAKL